MARLEMGASLDVVIGIIGALAGSVTGSYLTATLTRRNNSTEWLKNEQNVSLNQVLTEAAAVFVLLNRRYRRVITDPMDWEPWRRIVTQASLVLPGSVFEAVCELDRQVFILNLAVKNSPRDLGDGVWQKLSVPWRQAREELIDTARVVSGVTGSLTRSGGRPSPDEEVWSASYWMSCFQELEAAESKKEVSSLEGP
jgi:hypothetical protein